MKTIISGIYQVMENGTIEFEDGNFFSSEECLNCDVPDMCNSCPYSITQG